MYENVHGVGQAAWHRGYSYPALLLVDFGIMHYVRPIFEINELGYVHGALS
jgi:hypothetical protein